MKDTYTSLGIDIELLPGRECWTILDVLAKGLTRYPREILSECLRIWTDMSEPYHQSAYDFFHRILLPPETSDQYTLAYEIHKSDKDLRTWTLDRIDSVIESEIHSDVTRRD